MILTKIAKEGIDMIRINAKSIGIKMPIRVNETIKNVKATFKFQSNVVKSGVPTGKNQAERIVSYYDGQVKAIDLIANYISDVLNLTAKQVKKLYETDFPKIEALAHQIASKMLHYDDNDKGQSKGKK